MPKITLRALRDTRHIKALLREGQTIELTERGNILGRIVPAAATSPPLRRPNFAADRRAIFGDRIVPGSVVIEERGRY